ncbi:MAG: cation:dicarboxylase symporter family transporter [Negativicutes bacterium]|nr:cation:dicarboxylase symporter family transporter [Negativicutes bacterium]
MIGFLRRLTLARQIYLATAAGLVIGLVFGGRCAILADVSRLFIQFAQIAIMPYIIIAIINAIGGMSGEMARLVGKKVVIALVLLWIPSMIFSFFLPLSFPVKGPATFYNPAAGGELKVDLVDMFVPANPFNSLAVGNLPAIVVFCLLVGITLIGMKDKQGFLRGTKFLGELMERLNDNVMRSLPFGMLAVTAYVSGTIDFSNLKGTLVYVVPAIFYLVFITLLVFPALVVSTTPVGWRRLFDCMMPSLLLSFSTGNVFAALPLIYNSMHRFHDELPENAAVGEEQRQWRKQLIDMVLPLIWVVPASYKFMVLFFVQFATWYYGQVQSLSRDIVLYIAGLPTMFGSAASIMPFFLKIADLPDKAYSLFMLIHNFLNYFFHANIAAFVICGVIICYVSIAGLQRLSWPVLGVNAVLCLVVYAGAIFGMNHLFASVLSDDNSARQKLMNLHIAGQGLYREITVRTGDEGEVDRLTPRPAGEDLLRQIVSTKTLRVGYVAEEVPFAFVNERGQLAGFDIAMAHDLARELGVRQLEFYPVLLDQVDECLAGGKVDIVMSGLVPRRINELGIDYSTPYLMLQPALVLPVGLAQKYDQAGEVLKDRSLTFGVEPREVDQALLAALPPERTVVLDGHEDYFQRGLADVYVTSAEVGYAETIVHPLHKVLLINEIGKGMFCAYPVRDAAETANFLAFVNNWLAGCQMDGSIRRNYQYWVMGEEKVAVNERWSLLDWWLADR